MKYKIHLIVLGTLIFTVLLLVTLYYTQDFSEEVSFKSSITYEDMKIKTETQNSYRNDRNDTYITSVNANLGSLKLVNDGIFPQRYDMPEYLGCIEIAGTSPLYFEFRIRPSVSTGYGSDYLTVQTGQTKGLDLIGTFTGRRLYDITTDNLGDIKVFKLPNKEDNPFGNSYYYKYNHYSNLCNDYMNNEKPDAEILII